MSVSNPVGGYPTTGLPGHYGNTTADTFTGNGSMAGNTTALSLMTTGASSCTWDQMLGTTVCDVIQDTVTNATVANAMSFEPAESLFVTIFLGILAGCISVLTILGNILVLLGFGLERSIRQPTNYFLASLAVSDLLIGTFSMPLFTQYLLLDFWPLGTWLCDLWLSLDWTVCLTSQYTVFLITMDRFLSVKIPAKYRNWRTERKVLVMIAITWILPMFVFFTSIIGWQYFVGERKVQEYSCEVQFMGDPLFVFLLTLGYYWITLVVMCTLYAGIYMVALKLQRKSDAKQKILKSAMELAADHGGLRNTISNSSDSPVPKAKSKNKKSTVENNKPQKGMTKTTSFSKQKPKDNDDDRSSSPAFASDEENSSSQGAGGGSSKTPLTSNNKPKRIKEQEGFINNALQPDSCKLHRSPVEFLLPTQMPGINLLPNPEVRVDFPSEIGTDPSTHVIDIDMYSSSGERMEKSSIPLLQNEIFKGSKYIDEKSFQSLNSENIKFLVDSAPNDTADDADDQGSPVWRRRSSVEGGILVTVDAPSGPAPLQDKREFMLDDEVAADLQKGDNGTSNNQAQSLTPEDALEERGMQRLALAARKRRKNGRLQNLVKSVRSRNSRRRNRRERKSKSENRARKALRTITFILGAFILCWTPYHIMVLVIAICQGFGCINLKFYNFTYWLCYLNSPINPFCYAFANAQFKRTFIRILKLDWHRT
ncbi:hypothetical protein SNE40_010683 [Patella caerulea]|uniref:G-protein coupled receptors family 1 profile domain-containing protein n=1 Tax=Patella caerulea TaxID=87958 RepID=A0AAN8JQY5_PATCE